MKREGNVGAKRAQLFTLFSFALPHRVSPELDMNVLIAETQRKLAFAKHEVTEVRLSGSLPFYWLNLFVSARMYLAKGRLETAL